MIKRLFLLIWFFAAATTFAQGVADQDHADRLYYQKQYGPALEAYETLLQTDSKNTYLLGKAGLCLYALQRFQKAKEKFRLATLYCPVDDKEKMALYYTNLSSCYNHLGDYSRAYEYAVKAYNMDKTSEAKLWNAASHAQNLGRYEDAIRMMDQAVIGKNNAFLTLYGRCYLGTGRYRKSVDSYEMFFKNERSDDDFAAIDRRVEQRNLVYAYAYLAGNEQMDTLALEANIERMRVLIAASGTDSLKEQLLRLFLVKDNLCGKYAYPQALCEKLFVAITGKSSATERLRYSYYIRKDYKQTFEDAGRLIRSGDDPGSQLRVKRLQYLSAVHRLVQDYRAHQQKVNQPLKDTAIVLFSSLLEKGKKYNNTDLRADKELYQLVSETLEVFQQYFSTPEEQKAAAPLLLSIMEYLPDEKVRKELTAILRKGYRKN